MELEHCLYFNINALARKLTARWERAFAEFGLPPAHATLLLAVLTEGQVSQQELAKTLRLDKSTVARFIGKLENQGLVERVPTIADPREKRWQPTSRAVQVGQAIDTQNNRLYEDVAGVLGADNLTHFVAQSRVIMDRLDSHKN